MTISSAKSGSFFSVNMSLVTNGKRLGRLKSSTFNTWGIWAINWPNWCFLCESISIGIKNCEFDSMKEKRKVWQIMTTNLSNDFCRIRFSISKWIKDVNPWIYDAVKKDPGLKIAFTSNRYEWRTTAMRRFEKGAASISRHAW